jgi:hypothetical protein
VILTAEQSSYGLRPSISRASKRERVRVRVAALLGGLEGCSESFFFSCELGCRTRRVVARPCRLRCPSVPDSGVFCPADPRLDPVPICALC